MAAFDWRNNLFQGSEQMRGLSGGAGSAVALDDANSFYNFRLRRHYTDEDVAEDPSWLWFTNEDRDARTGLGPHVADALTEGQRFTDVLVVLSEDDWENCTAEMGDFHTTISDTLRKHFEEFLAKSAIGPMSRPLAMTIVKDGSDDVGGTDFGLVEGEFITGLMPNLYRGPGPASSPIIKLMVNIPGAWEGYREVGRLYDDQVLYTVGDHWLDNFHHPSLREAALYRLQRDEEGSFFHIVNPDLQDRYHVTSTDQNGTSVITLASREGDPLAYVVLAVLDAEDAEDAAAAEAPAPAAESSPSPGAHEDAPSPLQPIAAKPRSRGSKTIIPEAHSERIFTLQERGALLQKVHFSAFMLGYDVYLGHRGELGTVVDQPAATFQVRKKTVSLLANADNVQMDGEPIPAGESRLIEGDAVIQVGNQRLDYRELRHITSDGWPYVGEIRRPASSTYMLWGKDYAIGRSRDSRVVLPDEPRNDNIVWKPKVGDGATIKSKTGEIPKSRFYTDSIMVASEHAAVELAADVPYLSCHARHCYTYIRRDGDVMSLFPAQSDDGAHRLPLLPGDEVLIGNCVFHVGYSPTDDAPPIPSSKPAPKVSSKSLVDAVDMPSFEDESEAPTAPMPASDLPEVEAPSEPEPTPAEDPAPDLFAAEDNLPSVDDQAEEAAPAKVEKEAEDGLHAALRSWPDADEDEIMEAADAAPSAPAAPQPEPEPVEAAPTPTPPASPAAGSDDDASAEVPAPPSDAGTVVYVEDDAAQFELARPARLVQVGWAVNGTVTCGNHADADVILPENRIDEDQTFEPKTYFELRVRGKRGKLDVVDAGEVRIDEGAPEASYKAVDDLTISVIRRDEEGDEDFTVDLTVVEDVALPDPRARLLSLDTDERLAVALMTRGFPVRAPRTLELNGLTLTGTFDGSSLEITDYLDSYRAEGGAFRAFFVGPAGERFITAPEDGSAIQLSKGDRLVVEGAVYRFDVA